MCGRYTLAISAEQLELAMPWLDVPDQLGPRYNIAPGQPVAVVPNDGTNKLDFFNWGLIPSWAKDIKIGYRMINARGETLAEKPSFRAAYRRRRCLILADGFFEWRAGVGKSKTPYYIRLASGHPFAFAGLWEIWHSPDGSVIPSCTIITTRPNSLVAPLHDRMPVILPAAAFEHWLDTAEVPPQQLQPLLEPYPADLMTAYPVSTLVNSPANEWPDIILPVAT